MNDKITCLICQKTMKTINNKHLATHDITAEEYKERFPGASLLSEASAAFLSARSVKSNAKRKGIARSLQVRKKMSQGQRRYFETNSAHNKGVPMSDDQKLLISQKAKERYANGFIHPNQNKHLAEKTKQNISKTVKEFQVKQKPILRRYMLDYIYESDLTLLSDISNNFFDLKCNKCKYEFKRHVSMFHASNFHTRICSQCYPKSYISAAENEIYQFILQYKTNVIISDRSLIAPFEIDIFLPIEKIAFEYCGLYWHSEIAGKNQWYHKTKMENCIKNDVRLITIFEDEWLNKSIIVKSMIKNILKQNSTIINGRSCEIKQISQQESSIFLNENHIQGNGRSSIKYGLFFNNELVSVMIFIKGEISRKNEDDWEINRFASKLGYTVRGGASKLFSRFLKDHSPEKVISYADLRWGNGNVYSNLGFRLSGIAIPGYWYFHPNEMKRYHRFALRKTPNDPTDKTEWEIRQEQGWNRIWDCGHAKWIWQR